MIILNICAVPALCCLVIKSKIKLRSIYFVTVLFTLHIFTLNVKKITYFLLSTNFDFVALLIATVKTNKYIIIPYFKGDYLIK